MISYIGFPLGVHKDWERPALPEIVGISDPNLPSEYGRLVGLHRVMGDNITYGTCVPTMCCNALQTYLGRRNIFNIIPDSIAPQILKIFDPTLMAGMIPEDMFEWWKVNPICGYKLDSYRVLHPSDRQQIMSSIVARGGVGFIVALTDAQMNSNLWLPIQGNPVGEHAIYNDQIDGPYSVSSWGMEQLISPEFINDPNFTLVSYDFEIIPA